MGSVKRSISLTHELAEALDEMAKEQGLDRSKLVEILLRENPALQQRIQRKRGVSPARTKRDRSMTELSFLAKAARRQWEKKEAEGEVRLLEPD